MSATLNRPQPARGSVTNPIGGCPTPPSTKRETLRKADPLALARTVDHIYVAKGKSVLHWNMKRDKPDDDSLAKHLLGPTGNLRAPIIRKGRTLAVGFDEATYEAVFC